MKIFKNWTLIIVFVSLVIIIVAAFFLLSERERNVSDPLSVVEQVVQEILARKYEKTLEETTVQVLKYTGNHATGSVRFGPPGMLGEGGAFLAAKLDSQWQVVYDGNGAVNCQKMKEEYGFSLEILRPQFCD